MKKNILLLMLLCTALIYSQEKDNQNQNKSSFEAEDIEYEIDHKNQPWFIGMKDGANYFDIKKNYDTYFGQHQWEKSKPRSLGESWIKSKIFYLDKNGKVQAEPNLSQEKKINSTSNYLTTDTTLGTWDLLGPVNSATTNYSANGNHGGFVFLNRIDPTNNQKMFVSFVTGGMWMTSDGGANWNIVDTNLPDEEYLDIDVAISNPTIVYAVSKKQVIKSTDGGLNWASTTLTDGSYSGTGYDIAVSTSNPNIVVARWGDKIYRTTDGGTTWSSVISGLGIHSIMDGSVTSEILEWSATNPNLVYSASTNHNNQVTIHYSVDAGATFSVLRTITLDAGANGQVVSWAKLLMSTNNNTSIYVAVGNGDSARGHRAVQLYKLNATTGVQEALRLNMIPGPPDGELHHGDIAMDRNNENLIVYGTYSQQTIHVSTDNGASFTESTALTHYDIRSVDVIDNRILVGSDGESILSTDNGTTMTTLTNSISNHELWGFGSAFKTNLVAAGINHGPVMIKEAANGFDWYNGPGADQGNTDVNPLDDRYIYSQGYSNYRFFRTGTHTLINESNFLDLGGIYSYFNSIEFHPNKYYTIITHHAGQYPSGNENLETWKNSLIKTDDNGNSISIIRTFNNQVFREKISMKNPDHMYVVEGLSNNNLWHTPDGGNTWVDITPSAAESSNQTNISDIAVGDENPNEIWVTYSGVQTACKVLKSNDFGATWTNLTQPNLTSSPITKIIFQRGSNGGVYIGNKSGVYYRNNTMPNWEPLGNGLPMLDIRFMFINYNEGKLKIGTSRGAFSHDLYETSPPNALISVSNAKITCPSAESVQFKDYSVVRNASATWSWSFPGGTPATSTEENPLVSYVNAANGFYDVTLTVTDAYGTSTQTLTNFIEVSNQCGNATPETISGNKATLSGQANADFLEVDNLNLNKNSFTFSCWIKPNGIQEDFSAIFSTQGINDEFVFNFSSGNNTLGFHPTWWWDSGLIATADEWSHVALVSNGTNIKIYVNGAESVNNTALSSEVFNKLNLGRYGNGRTDRYANLEMDEVCIWNRPLSRDEIRKWRHLTKSDAGAPILTGLVAYYQFNEDLGNISINKTANPQVINYMGTSGSLHNPSDAPVFGGISEKIVVSTPGLKDFSTTGLSMTFASGTNPNGEIWVSRATINPDTSPNPFNLSFNSYFIVNNYGTNATFTALDDISFTANSEYINSPASDYNLYKRETNAHGDTWGSVLDTGDVISGSGSNTKVTFSTGLNITSFGQFVLTNNAPAPSPADGIPGNLATLTGQANDDYLVVDNLNLNKNSFTFSCWIKPNGTQEDWSAIFNTQDANLELALNFRSGNNGSNTLGFHPTWAWDSELIAPANEWSHVAMVSNGTNVKLYVNGIESVNPTALPNEIFNTIDLGRYGRGRTNRYTNLEMDEVCFWNRPLSIDEVRQARHLTKNTDGNPILTGLVAYYQFNESSGNISTNNTPYTNDLIYQGSSSNIHNISTAPVFEGVSEKITVNTPGLKDFSTTGLSIDFQSGTTPNGDVWVSRGAINPDQLPDGNSSFNSYFIVNNYGLNTTFTPLNEMSFTNNSAYVSSNAAAYSLYKRESNAFGPTWGSVLDTGDAISGSGSNAKVTFSMGLNINSFSQFILSDNGTLNTEDVAIKKSEKPIIFPNPLKSNQSLTIKLSDKWLNSTMVTYGVLGNKLTKTILTKSSNEVLLNLPPGTYFLFIYNQKENYSKKIIIQ